jgi:hypothetical protein
MTSANTVVSSRSRSRYFASSLSAGAIILLAASCSTSSGSGAMPTTIQTIFGPTSPHGHAAFWVDVS